MARGPSKPSSGSEPDLTADEWLRLRDAIDPEIRTELREILEESDLSTLEGFSRAVMRLAMMSAGMKIHPTMAHSTSRFLELALTGLMASKGQASQGGPQNLIQVLQLAKDQLPERPQPPRLVVDEDDD